MWKLRQQQFVGAVVSCGAALALVVACSSSDDSSGTNTTGGSGGSGGKASGNTSGASSGGKSGASTGGTASAGANHGGASNGGATVSGGSDNGGEAGEASGGAPGEAGAANGGGGTANGGAANGGSAGKAGSGGAATAGSGGAATAGTGGAATAGAGGAATAGTGGAATAGTGGAATAGSGGATAGSGGSGGFTPVAITLLNPSFELSPLETKGTVEDWQVSGANTVAAYGSMNPSDAGHTGTGRLALYLATAYQVGVAQTVTGLTNGTYTLSAWLEGASGANALYLYATGYSTATPSAQLKTDVAATLTQSYVQYSVTNIVVTSGTLTIGVYADEIANNWANLDDFTLTRVQ